jgi:hypothetical protein
MNLDRVRERLQNGFKPFVIEMSSGKRVSVWHPEFVIVGKGTVVVMGEDDAVTMLDALHISSIQDAPTPRRHR